MGGKEGLKKKLFKEYETTLKHFLKKHYYWWERTNKEYLDGSLNIATMYRFYVERCKSNNEDAAKLSMYSKILNTETNIAFHVPKIDSSVLCTICINENKEQKLN